MSDAPSNQSPWSKDIVHGAEQIYVTHCLATDSYSNQAGFTIRASSTNDPELLEFARNYPGYELPLEMWGQQITLEHAPRRLAMVRATKERIALISSSYLPEDTLGRKNSYFTHIIFYNNVTLHQALECWSSPSWVSYYPHGSPKHLSSFPGLPAKGPINNRDIITNFLTSSSIRQFDSLFSSAYFINRFEDQKQNCQLMTIMLKACIFMMMPDISLNRGRFYILGEPGLIALLLYGVAMLLPWSKVNHLTFSTYENLHRTLRQYRMAKVVGTFAADPKKRLERDYFSSRGLALDTFTLECSQELQEPITAVDKLVALAAEGNWDLIARLQQFLSDQDVSFASLENAIESAHACTRVRSGMANRSDYLRLAASTPGSTFLNENATKVWDYVKFNLRDRELRRCFASIVKKRWNEVRRLAQDQLLRDEDPSLYDLYLSLPRDLAPEHSDECWCLLADLVRPDLFNDRQRLAPDLRHRIRRALLDMPSDLDKRIPMQQHIALWFQPQSDEEFYDIEKLRFSPYWKGKILFQALRSDRLSPKAISIVRKRLYESLSFRELDSKKHPTDPHAQSLFQSFCDELSQLANGHRVKFLGRVFSSEETLDQNANFLKSLVDYGIPIPLGFGVQLFATFSDDIAIWATNDSLRELLLYWERDHPQDLEALLRRMCGLITIEVVFDHKQQELLDRLMNLQRQLLVFPESELKKLKAWDALRVQLKTPTPPSVKVFHELETACKQCGTTKDAVLETYLSRCMQAGQDIDLDSFQKAFLSFYGLFDLSSYQIANDAFKKWCAIIAALGDEIKIDHYKRYFLEQIPEKIQAAILKRPVESKHGGSRTKSYETDKIRCGGEKPVSEVNSPSFQQSANCGLDASPSIHVSRLALPISFSVVLLGVVIMAGLLYFTFRAGNGQTSHSSRQGNNQPKDDTNFDKGISGTQSMDSTVPNNAIGSKGEPRGGGAKSNQLDHNSWANASSARRDPDLRSEVGESLALLIRHVLVSRIDALTRDEIALLDAAVLKPIRSWPSRGDSDRETAIDKQGKSTVEAKANSGQYKSEMVEFKFMEIEKRIFSFLKDAAESKNKTELRRALSELIESQEFQKIKSLLGTEGSDAFEKLKQTLSGTIAPCTLTTCALRSLC